MTLSPGTVILSVVLLSVVAFLAYFVLFSFVWGAGYAPSSRGVARGVLRLAGIGPGDVVYDLGAGTGSIVFAAVGVGARRVVGVEIEPIRAWILRVRRWFHPRRSSIEIRRANLFRVSLDEASVVVAFLWPGAMRRLGPTWVTSLRAGVRVVSHFYPIPGWAPTEVDADHRLFLYRLPVSAPLTVEVDPKASTDGENHHDDHGPGDPTGIDASVAVVGRDRHRNLRGGAA
jgi:hypothetical protein